MSLLREKMLMTARTTLHNPRLQQSRSNVLPLTKHGWKCLKTSCWVAFLNDKDGGFTLVHEDHVPQAHMEVLNSRLYREVFREMYRGDLVAKQYKNLCADVERVMGEVMEWPGTCFAPLCVGVPLRSPSWIPLSSLSQRCWFRDVPQHSQFVLLQSGRFVTVGCARTQILAAHAMSSPQGHTPVCEAHKYQVRET